MTDLFVCLDPGGSQTKIIYQLGGDEKPRYLLMSPEVEKIYQRDLDFYFNSKGWIGYPDPTQQAWIQVEQKIYVVGAFANHFDPSDRLKELKYENALYKVLAAVGVIVEKHDLPHKKKLKLQLALLLPANEYNDRQRFQERLAQLLESFSFRGKVVRFKMERFLCRPEGGGLISIAVIHHGIDWLRERNVGALMLGHRNVSALYFESGEMKRIDSPLMGFSNFLDGVVALTSGLEREQLNRAIYDCLDAAGNSILLGNDCLVTDNSQINYQKRPDWENYKAIQNLATANDFDLWDSELLQIVNAIKSVRFQYWLKLQKWINRIFERSLDAVVISGGAARFLEPELEYHFNCEPIFQLDKGFRSNDQKRYVHTGEYRVRNSDLPFTPIIWGAGLQEEIETTFDLTTPRSQEMSLSYRLVDAYGLFDQLLSKNLRERQSKSSSSEAKASASEESKVEK